MTPRDVKIGTRLELDLLNNKGDKVGYTYISQLLEHRDDGTIMISAPIYEARLIYIPSDIQVRISFIDRQSGLLCFNALVKGRMTHDNVAVLIVEPSGDIEKLQRRMHYRLDIALTAMIFPSNPFDDFLGESAASRPPPAVNNEKSGTAAVEASKPVSAVTRNISGSGLCLVTDKEIPKDAVLNVELHLDGNKAIRAECKVVRSTRSQYGKGRKYELGMFFTKISRADQDALIRYIYKQQMTQLKNRPNDNRT